MGEASVILAFQEDCLMLRCQHHIRNLTLKYLVLVAMAFSYIVGICSAQEVVPAEDIVKALKASTSPTIAVSASNIVQSLKAQIAVVPREEDGESRQLQTPELDAMATLNVEIFFEYNSDVIKQSSLSSLVQLGNALVSSELTPNSFLIIGHSDSKGERVYNIKLSERRAAAVRNFLGASFPACKERLSSIGLGEEKLRNTTNPEGEENRRVQIVNLGLVK